MRSIFHARLLMIAFLLILQIPQSISENSNYRNYNTYAEIQACGIYPVQY
jgi:hypothetical protein